MAERHDCPARIVYDALGAAPALTSAAYARLIDALHPVYLEEVVCPVNVAVGHLRTAARAVDDGAAGAARSAHTAARGHLYQALRHAGLLTIDEELQELVAGGALRGVSDWSAWRAH